MFGEEKFLVPVLELEQAVAGLMGATGLEQKEAEREEAP